MIGSSRHVVNQAERNVTKAKVSVYSVSIGQNSCFGGVALQLYFVSALVPFPALTAEGGLGAFVR